jgi:hypothetical protein
MDRSLTSLRVALLVSLPVPFLVAAFVGALAGDGQSPELLAVIAIAVAGLAATFWCQALEHARKRRRPDDDDDGWRRGSDDEPPRPHDGPGGVNVDWDAFERDFAAYASRRTPSLTA